ncbi:MAG: methyltransferase domain-containing protein, partial [Desulfobacterales bacterium]|nr:methyltransferase domain-containing protein [Desulfobacterales bacterium]
LFDLVLRAKDKTKRVKVKEDYGKADKIKKGDKEYFEGLDNWSEDLLQDNYNVIKNLSEGTVLDLGCGTGRLDLMLSRSGREVEGVDVNDIALKMAKAKGLKMRKFNLEKGNLPYDNDLFDNVIMVHSLEHLDNPTQIIKEARRIASKKVVIISPLGDRADTTHKQKFTKLEDFKALFIHCHDTEVKKIKETNSAMAVIDITKFKKVALKPFGAFAPPKPTMAGLTEAFSVEQIWSWAKDRFPLDVEEKLNGFRCLAEKSGDKIRIKTEG